MPRGQPACGLDQPVGQGGLLVVDVSDDAEISKFFQVCHVLRFCGDARALAGAAGAGKGGGGDGFARRRGDAEERAEAASA